MAENAPSHNQHNTEQNPATRSDQQAADQHKQPNYGQREPLPTEMRDFVLFVRQLLHEIRGFLSFIRHTGNYNAAIVFLTLLLAIASFTQALIYGLQIGPLRRSAEAAASAAQTAHNTLILSQRPWIKIKHHIKQPLTFNVAGNNQQVATMALEDTIENIGNTVALNVISWEDVIPKDSDLSATTARARQKQWCDANKMFDSKNPEAPSGYALFPRDPFIQISHVGPAMKVVDKAVESNKTHLGRFFPNLKPGDSVWGKVEFVVVGCVVYRSAFDPDGIRPYITEFRYDLGEVGPEGGVMEFVAPYGVANKLQLIQFPYGDTIR